MILVVALLSLVIFILLAIPICHKRYARYISKYLENIPGPTPNAYFGNFLLFAGKPSYEILNIIQGLFQQYGDTIKFFAGPFCATVAIADEKLIEAVLGSSKLIEKSQEYTYLEPWLGTGLLTSTGQKWKKRRRMITPAFHFSILENFVEVFEKCGEVFIKQLEPHCGRKSFDVYPMVSLLTLDIICETAMGISLNAQTNEESEYPKNVKKICELMSEKNFSIILSIDPRLYLLTSMYYQEKKPLKIIHSHTEAVIDRKIKELQNTTIKDNNETEDIGIKKKVAFLDLLLKSTIDGQFLSRSDIKEEVDTFMFEGHDTTASALAFALYSLANHPLVQQKALDEQKSIFEDIKNAKPTMAQLQQMKYLEMVIKETLRLYPSVPFYARTVSEEYKYGNITFPKGQKLVIFAYVAHKNPKYFPEPLKFIPERFEKMDGTNPYMYIPFSAGPRNCIGQKFALLELKSTISKVLRNYQLLPAKNHELKLAAELILVSKSGVCFSIKKRE